MLYLESSEERRKRKGPVNLKNLWKLSEIKETDDE